MATKPEAWQEQSPVNPLNNESWTQGEAGATTSGSSPLQDKMAPRAEPEEDIDITEPGARDATPQENTFTRDECMHDGTKLENQESTRISECTPRETQHVVAELDQVPQKLSEASESEESFFQSEDVFPPPSPPLGDFSIEECFEKDGFASLEREAVECISDAEVISDPREDLLSPDSQNSQEWPQPAGQMVRSLTEEMTQDNVPAKQNDTQLNFLPDGFSNSELEYNAPRCAHRPPSDCNSSADAHAVCSPPFVDESEEDEEVNMDAASSQQQQASLDTRSELFQASCSASVSLSTEQDTTALPAVPSPKQQEELLTQSQCNPASMGGNQEAAQQVHGQSSPPLSTVSIEVSNQGGAASQACGCAVAVTERHNRAGERTERESEQAGGEEGQKESVLERDKAGQQQSRGLSKAEKYTCGVSFTHSRHSRMESDSCDDSQSDSGVSADFSPCSTSESNSTSSTPAPKETPIEREIRRAIEREHSLRRSRGLPNPPTSPEYVDIPLRKTVLSQSLTGNSERHHGKDRQFAGKKMQHDIHRETQREQDLVRLGMVPGFYDKGTVRQLKDRKQIFEVFQKPSASTLTVSARSKVTSWSLASDISTLENQEDVCSQASTIGASHGERRHSLDLLSPMPNQNSSKEGGSTNLTARGPGFSEATACQVIILENNLIVPAVKLYHTQQEAKDVVDSGNPYHSSSCTVRKQEKKEEVDPKENPFFKLRPSTNLGRVEQEIREAKEREKELREQRTSVYRETGQAKGGGRGGRPTSTEEKTPIMFSSTPNGPAVPGSSASSPGGATGSPAARQSVGKLGMWPPAQAEEENITRPEVLQSPRPPRKKTPLVHRWESGIVNGHSEH